MGTREERYPWAFSGRQVILFLMQKLHFYSIPFTAISENTENLTDIVHPWFGFLLPALHVLDIIFYFFMCCFKVILLISVNVQADIFSLWTVLFKRWCDKMWVWNCEIITSVWNPSLCCISSSSFQSPFPALSSWLGVPTVGRAHLSIPGACKSKVWWDGNPGKSGACWYIPHCREIY